MLFDFSTLKLNDDAPIYQQVIRFVKVGIALGEAKSGDELPSRRMLSVLLGVNPNTIQKCCRIMEDEGFLLSQSGAKSVLSFDNDMAESMKRTLYIEETQRYIGEMKRLRLGKEEVVDLMDKFWSQQEDDEDLR